MSDPFDELYETGILEELPPETERAATRAQPAEPFALKGCVITPDRKLDDGYVVVSGAKIDSVGAAKPQGVRIVDTDGVILPGLIDLHGHPEYNVFAAWEPPRLFPNRYAWRGSDEYRVVVKEPWKRLTDNPSLLRDLTRYAEGRALVGGVTAIQGASAKYPGKEEALVRNVDLRIFGQHKARSVVDLSRSTPDDRRRLRDKIDAGEVTAVYVHLAEGLPSNERSRREFDELVAANLLTPATVIIHGTALSRAQLQDAKDAGAKLVWSPQSNLRLYGETTAAADALDVGLTLGLGADWLPSGSQSLLAEQKVARRTLQGQGVSLTKAQLAKKLVDMVTTDAAEIAGLGDHLGKLAPDRAADILVLERHVEDPWENVVEADPSWVELVTIGGDLAYGRAEWIQELSGPAEKEDLFAWGKPMAMDTSYVAQTAATPSPRLREIRERLLARYPQTGPIFA
ncbi:MAG TPA: amidohydrolase family protein [Gaiellaceae bacterium]|nr:amidohydrolase family protein [Gaiellaceae bacterium]